MEDSIKNEIQRRINQLEQDVKTIDATRILKLHRHDELVDLLTTLNSAGHEESPQEEQNEK